MKIIPTTVHAMLDYTVGLLLVLAPLYLNLNDSGAARAVLIFSGIVTIVYSIFTDYEYSVLPLIPMHTHLLLDIFSALFLATSPWICGFNNEVWMPHVLFAILEIIVVSLSQSVTRTARHFD
jgi:hypothetical protein